MTTGCSAHLDHDCPACRAKRGEECWVEMSLDGVPQGDITTIDGVWVHQTRVIFTVAHTGAEGTR